MNNFSRVRFGKSYILHWAREWYGHEWMTLCRRNATGCERDNPDWPDWTEICFPCKRAREYDEAGER